ncbi:MAG: hypothetical protein IT293_05090 [Deltaproteobacteria bacterium]|nr:hypothetical protein [Deltaproteobacteria bacterium]
MTSVRLALRRWLPIAGALGLAACAAAAKPAGPPPFPSPGPDCQTICHRQYKECANGDPCMMTPACDMEVCIPRKQDCLAHCAGAQ